MKRSCKSTPSSNLVKINNFLKRRKKNIFGKCSICLEDIKFCKTAHFLPCCHYFHKACINHWLLNEVTCPECRIPIFIQTSDQYEIYLEYNASQKNNYNFIRQNLQINDNAIARRFIRDKTYFNINILETEDLVKFQAIIDTPDPTMLELYSNMIDSDNDSLIDNNSNSNNDNDSSDTPFNSINNDYYEQIPDYLSEISHTTDIEELATTIIPTEHRHRRIRQLT